MAQPGVAFTGMVKKEKENFLQDISSVSNDSLLIVPVTRHFESQVNAVQNFIRSKKKLSTLEKEKAIRSLAYFIKELSSGILKQKLSFYDIPGAMNAYREVLNALLSHQPLVPVLQHTNLRNSELIAASFSQYEEHSFLDDIMVYKRVAASPAYILRFIESKPRFRFADSLLMEVAVNDPTRILFYLEKGRPDVQHMIRNPKNEYLRQLVALSDNKNVIDLLPFLSQIGSNELIPEEILVKRTEPRVYFQLMINTLMQNREEKSKDEIYLKPLRRGIRQKAMAFYVHEINDLHEAAENIRFASVKDLRPQDLYYIITSCGEDLYTSSYLGLYKRLMMYFRDQTADSLFGLVHYDELSTFIRLAANYNVLADFFQRLSPSMTKNIIKRFVDGIEREETTALEKAMDIADSFTALSSLPEINELINDELQLNLLRCTAAQHYLGIRVYSILAELLHRVNEEGGMKQLWSTLGNYEVLKQEDLTGKNNEITEVVLFYGDEDGVASFNSFLNSYTDKRKWQINRHENWISIRSQTGQPLTIYANRPLDSKDEMDRMAQDSLFAYLKEQSLEPTILVHRGHSYHLDKTLNRLSPSVRLAILGSCGGYNRSISIATISPDVQVIGSKKTGSKSINDPIIALINDELISKKDLVWSDVWNSLSKRFAKDAATLSMFNEYFPPANNLGLFVLKLFKYHCGSI